MISRVTEIQKERETLKRELDAIQEYCEHLNHTIGTYSWRPGTSDQAFICSDCDKMLGYTHSHEVGALGTIVYKRIDF